MTVSLLIISHHEIANAFLDAVKTTFGENLPMPTSTVEIQSDSDPDTLVPELKKICKSIDQGGGVLILTDIFGATPSNVAKKLSENENIRIVTGLNLPMLMRVLNYPDLTLAELAEKATTGGRCGIIDCSQDDENDK